MDMEVGNMLDQTQLPHLLKLLADDTPGVRETVLDALSAFGPDLESELEAMPEPLNAEAIRNVRALVAAHLWGNLPVPYNQGESQEVDPSGHFEPGQIVRHKRYGYRGVVVDIDPNCRASEVWYQSNQSKPEKDQPWYHVLVHNSMQVTYAAQSSLEDDMTGDEVVHPYVPYFFSNFEDGTYIRNDQPWPS